LILFGAKWRIILKVKTSNFRPEARDVTTHLMVCVGPLSNLIEGVKFKISALVGMEPPDTRLAVNTLVKLYKVLL